MVVPLATERQRQEPAGLRAMDPGRDLRAVARLIAAGFDQELDARGRAALRELTWMARLTPVVWWFGQVDPSFYESMSGFVWEVPRPEGRGREIVGNVSLNRAPGSRDRWIICNVVVRADWRRQGIARQLTRAAMNEAQSLAARSVVLQVFRDNHPALRLYTSLGFREVAGETGLWHDRVEPVSVPDAPGYEVRPWRASDGRAAFEVALQATPEPLQWLRPLKVEDWQAGWLARLFRQAAEVVGGRDVYHLGVWQGERLCGMASVTVALRRGRHHVGLWVDPQHRGRVEASLIGRVLHLLGAAPPRPVEAMLSTDHTVALDVLCDHGFTEQRTLLTLQRDFR